MEFSERDKLMREQNMLQNQLMEEREKQEIKRQEEIRLQKEKEKLKKKKKKRQSSLGKKKRRQVIKAKKESAATITRETLKILQQESGRVTFSQAQERAIEKQEEIEKNLKQKEEKEREEEKQRRKEEIENRESIIKKEDKVKKGKSQTVIDDEYSEIIRQNISKGILHRGIIFNNYVELCRSFGEIDRIGKAKELQYRNFERFLKLKRIEGSQKIKVEEIYSVPKPVSAKRNAFCTKLIEWILIEELRRKSERGEINSESGSDNECNSQNFQIFQYETTKIQLLYDLGIVNDNYLYQNRERVQYQLLKLNQDLNDNKKISKWDIDHFFLRSHEKLNSILMSALKSMRKRGVIDFEEEMVIVKSVNKKKVVVKAEEEDIKKIIESEKEVLVYMNLEVKPYADIKKFYNLLNKKLNEKYQWDRAFKRLNITWSNRYLHEDLNRVIEDIEYMLKYNQGLLSEEVERRLEKDALNRKKKNLQDIKKYDELFAKAKDIEIENSKKAGKKGKRIYKGIVGIEIDKNKDKIKFIYGDKERQGIGNLRYKKEDFKIPKVSEYSNSYIDIQERLAKVFVASLEGLL